MFNISFDFDEVTQKVSNLRVTSLFTIDEETPVVQCLSNKLKLTTAAIQMIGLEVGDRVQVNYWTENNHLTFPVIGKSKTFTDPNEGCKLTKSNTVAFKGNQNSTLKIYGNCFEIEPFKEGMFKMVPIEDEKDSVVSEQEDLDNLNSDELDSEMEDVLDLVSDKLPF